MADVKAKVKTPKKKASKREKKDWIAAYILIAPVTLGLLVFYIWPFIQNVWFSFNDVNKFNMSTFVGLANYKEMIGDKEVWRTFGNTLKYVIVTVPVGLALSHACFCQTLQFIWQTIQCVTELSRHRRDLVLSPGTFLHKHRVDQGRFVHPGLPYHLSDRLSSAEPSWSLYHIHVHFPLSSVGLFLLFFISAFLILLPDLPDCQ